MVKVSDSYNAALTGAKLRLHGTTDSVRVRPDHARTAYAVSGSGPILVVLKGVADAMHVYTVRTAE